MIITVTPNTCIDRTLFVPTFELNRIIRASRTVISMGGKPANASLILGELGIRSLALGFAAGHTGKTMENMLRERQVLTDFVWVGGETRIATVIVCEDGSGQSTFSVDTLEVESAHINELKDKYRKSLSDADCIILGGSLPSSINPNLYGWIVQEARNHDVPVVFDASGEGLIVGIKAGANFVKPNRAELEEVAKRTVCSIEDAYLVARDLQKQYGVSVIVTLGEDGALAVMGDRIYRIPPPQVEVVSTGGAGDGVLAGLAASLSRGDPIEDGLRLGFAAAGAICLTPGTADCRRADVESLLPTIELIPYN